MGLSLCFSVLECLITLRLLGGLDPCPRLCLLENVPGLKDVNKATGLSNYDAVKSALEGLGYTFATTQFDASDTGIPNRRPRLYMVAIAGMPAALEEGLEPRVQASIDSMLQQVTHRPLSDFLLEDFVPAETITDWMPELGKPRIERTLKKALPEMAACPSASDEGLYRARLHDNVWFQWLNHREQHMLLWHLCHHPFPGPDEGVVLLHSSAKFMRLARGPLVPCQVPNALFWLVGRDRLLTGAEALMLQGVDLGAIRGFSVDSRTSRFLQDLAGNAFCIYQFVLVFTACLPEALRKAA